VAHFYSVGYIKEIKRLYQEDNIGSLLEIGICRKADIISIPEPVGRSIYGSITFEASAGFVKWAVTSARMVIGEKTTRDGSPKANSLRLSIPKDRSDLREMFSIMEEDEFVVVYIENGKQKIFGLKEAPVRFAFGHDTGGDIGDNNAYSCRFFYEGPDNVYFYNGSISTAPAGPAPSIVKFGATPETAVAIASLAPGETLTIISDYDFNTYFSMP
jgi:uncharacterized protein (DUF2249 family)